MLTKKRIVCIATTLLAFLCLSDALAQTSSGVSGEMPLDEMAKQARRRTKLELSAETDKESYKRGDVLRLTVAVRNVTTAPINLYGDFSMGFASSFEIHIFDESGKCFVPSMAFESMVGIPQDKRDFVKLQGRHFMGTTFNIELQRFGMGPGKYTIVAEYHSPFWRSEDMGLELWPRDFGSIYSKPIGIEIASGK